METLGLEKALKLFQKGCRFYYSGDIHLTYWVTDKDFKGTDEYFDICIFHAEGNKLVTKCPPGVRKLHVHEAPFDNKSLAGCNNLVYLDVSYNKLITICPKTVKILNCSEFSCIDDEGLMGCDQLVELCADNNESITICPKSVKILRCNMSGIDDNGLEGCNNLENLYPNNHITKCPKSVKYLEMEEGNKITNEELLSLENLEELTIYNNKEITKLPTTLKVLRCYGISAIDDKSLEGLNLLEMEISRNPNITKCPKTLQVLNCSENSGINDNSLEGCDQLKELNASNNSKMSKIRAYFKLWWRLWN